MLLTHDPSTAATQLAAGALFCPVQDCAGRLGPWGHARQRVLRLGSGRSEGHTPRRARCRSCGGTHVILPARSYPRRPDTAEVVGTALVAAETGLGHRRVAELVALPPTTARGWLRRARANSEAVRGDATVAVHALDPEASPLAPTGSALGDMLEAVGAALAAAIRRFGPVPAPWQLAVVITGGAILALRPQPAWHGSG